MFEDMLLTFWGQSGARVGIPFGRSLEKPSRTFKIWNTQKKEDTSFFCIQQTTARFLTHDSDNYVGGPSFWFSLFTLIFGAFFDLSIFKSIFHAPSRSDYTLGHVFVLFSSNYHMPRLPSVWPGAFFNDNLILDIGSLILAQERMQILSKFRKILISDVLRIL